MQNELMDEELIDMYNPVDIDTDDNVVGQPQLSIANVQTKGVFHELTINDKKVIVPDASIIANMSATIKILTNRIIQLENSLRTTEFSIRQLSSGIDRTTRSLSDKLNEKIDK